MADDDLIGVNEASELLGVGTEQVETMVRDGLLVPADGSGEARFPRAEVLALRLQGG